MTAPATKFTEFEITGTATIATLDVEAVLDPVNSYSGTSTKALGTAVLAKGVAALSRTSNYAAYFNVAAIAVGQEVTLVSMDGTTGYNILACLTGQTFIGGSNNTATFDAAGDALVLVGVSSTKVLIKSNEGSVALSATT